MMSRLVKSFQLVYVPVTDEENDQDSEEIPPDYTEDAGLQYPKREHEKRFSTCTHRKTQTILCSFWVSWWPWIAHVVLFCTSAAMLGLSLKMAFPSSSARNMRWEETTSIFSPANEAIEYHVTKFNGSFDFPSVYRGVPTQELDDAWNWVSRDVGFIRVSDRDLEEMGYEDTSRSYMARYREEDGGGYLATVEVFHQLHCLNLLRKVTYRDYYEKTDPMFQEPPEFFRTHLDHCIELLRQALMCSADVGIITYDWVEGHKDPYPDFNTKHQCRDFERLLNWGREHLVKVPTSHLGRVGNEVDLNEVP